MPKIYIISFEVDSSRIKDEGWVVIEIEYFRVDESKQNKRSAVSCFLYCFRSRESAVLDLADGRENKVRLEAERKCVWL